MRSGRAVWQAHRAPRVAHARLTRDLHTDVLIVGAGISGALAADVLSEAGLGVVIVDRRGPVRGSTAASTALLQYELDVPLSWLSGRIGRGKAERFWRRSKLAVDALRERARRLGIRAQQRDRNSLYLSGNRLDRDGLLQELAARRHAGFDTRFLGSGEVERRFGIRGRTALLDDGNFEAEPRRLAAGFLNAALANGATLRAPVEVSDVSPGRRGVCAATAGGPVIRCSHLVFATGYEIPKGIPRGGHDIRSTWAIATKPQPRAVWEGAAMIWEASEPYLYLRTTREGRIICGGEDEGFQDEGRRDALLAAKTATLATKLKALLPRVDPTPEFSWCGSFGASPDGMPTIGCIPRMAHCYAVMGYGGNGITFAMMAAQMLRGLITGSGDSDLDLVAFRRRASPPQVFS